MSSEPVHAAVFVGGGPAGLAPLIAASKNGKLVDLLAAGIAVVDARPRLGAGSLEGHAINSDSVADTFLNAIEGDIDPRLSALSHHPTTLALATHRGGPAPLPLVGAFLGLIGDQLAAMLDAAPNSRVLTGHTALDVRQRSDGIWITRIRPTGAAAGGERELLSRSVVMATGAAQPLARLAEQSVCGAPLLPRYQERLMQSGDVLSAGGLAEVTRRLQAAAPGRSPRIVIVGGSQSALATAHALLHAQPSIPFGPAGVTVLHRRTLRVTYNSAAEALAEGDTDFTDDDICPLSGRVFRLGGFRLESRELVMRGRGIGGRPPEPRLRLHQLAGERDVQAEAWLEEADLVIAALGYRPRALTVLDAAGTRIDLLAESLEMLPLVGSGCKVLDSRRLPIPGLFGIGLAAGFVPRGGLGGERSFVGQANGLWLWQNDVGELITDAVLDAEQAAQAVPLMRLNVA